MRSQFLTKSIFWNPFLEQWYPLGQAEKERSEQDIKRAILINPVKFKDIQGIPILLLRLVKGKHGENMNPSFGSPVNFLVPNQSHLLESHFGKTAWP